MNLCKEMILFEQFYTAAIMVVQGFLQTGHKVSVFFCLREECFHCMILKKKLTKG